MNHTWNYPLLAAELDVLKWYYFNAEEINFRTNTGLLEVLVRGEEETEERVEVFKVEGTEEEIRKHLIFPEIYGVLCSLYNLPPRDYTEEQLLSLSILFEYLQHPISRCKISKGNLSYYYKGYKWENPDIPPYEALVCGKMLREGYKVEVVPGSHFYIYNSLSPAPRKLYTTQHFCSCTHFERYRTCNHLNMVRGVLEKKVLRELRELSYY
jgi:hypothetical protein